MIHSAVSLSLEPVHQGGDINVPVVTCVALCGVNNVHDIIYIIISVSQNVIVDVR